MQSQDDIDFHRKRVQHHTMAMGHLSDIERSLETLLADAYKRNVDEDIIDDIEIEHKNITTLLLYAKQKLIRSQLECDSREDKPNTRIGFI